MRRYHVTVVYLLLIAVLLTGCGDDPQTCFDNTEIPPEHGEICEYYKITYLDDNIDAPASARRKRADLTDGKLDCSNPRQQACRCISDEEFELRQKWYNTKKSNECSYGGR